MVDASLQYELPYAGFWRRGAAFAIDCLVVIISISVLILASKTFARYGAHAMYLRAAEIFVAVASFLGTIFYFAALEASERRATVGKLLMKIRVTDLGSGQISFQQGIWRVLLVLPLCVGVLLIPFTSRKQALHDLLTRSLVQKDRSSA
jgi:uncharacterized RDD family membrane protein YckC